MTVTCHIHLLDCSEVDFKIGKSAKASALLDLVLQHLNIAEKDYFGLIYKGSALQKAWLNPDKKIKKQIKKDDLKVTFDFAVKFYPTDPTKLKEEITRYQICLQVRRDLASHLDCSTDKLSLLLSYWMQSEYEGKNDNSKAVKDCLKDFKTPPTESSSAEFVDTVLALYRSRDGMPSSDADTQFLATATGLRTYGVHFYNGKDTTGNNIGLGISAKGVVERRDGQGPAFHPWKRIKNILYKNKKFKIQLLLAPTNGDPRLKKSFLFDSEKQVNSIWKSAVEHHVFFRVGEKYKQPKPPPEKKPKKRSFLRRFSSKSKRPKTEADAQQESEGIARHQPTVTRASTLRRSVSLRQSTASESSIEQKRPIRTEKGGASYLVSREAQMDTENSSSEETKPLKTDNPKPLLLHIPLPADETYAQIVEKAPEHDKEGEHEDEDNFTEGVFGTQDGGSTSLLLTETIQEEEEQGQPQAIPPKKPHRPVQYAPLRDEDNRLPSISKQQNDSTKRPRPIESDLDAEVLLSPTSPKNDISFAQLQKVSPKLKDSSRKSRESGKGQFKVMQLPKPVLKGSQRRLTPAENEEEKQFLTSKEHVPDDRNKSTDKGSRKGEYGPEICEKATSPGGVESPPAGDYNFWDDDKYELLEQNKRFTGAKSMHYPLLPVSSLAKESAEILIFDSKDGNSEEEESDRNNEEVLMDECVNGGHDDYVDAPEDELASGDSSHVPYYAPPTIPRLNLPEEPPYQLAALKMDVDFKGGESQKPSVLGKTVDCDVKNRTVAILSDEDALDGDDILYEDKRPVYNEHKKQNEFLTTFHGELNSRSTSLSDVTDDTDELLVPDVLEKAWSEGAGLDEDDELFQALFGTPPTRRKDRNLSGIDPRDARKGRQKALDEDPIRPRRREHPSKRPIIPSWPFVPVSVLDSRNVGADLDRAAIRAALDAQRELTDEDQRLEEMEMMEDVDDYFSTPDDNFLSRSSDYSHFRDHYPKPTKVPHTPKIEELLSLRLRSRSASPRMVGEEFIPGVPDFVHSVVPYQLETPRKSEVAYLKPIPRGIPRKSANFAAATFEGPVSKFSSHARKNGHDSYRCSPTVKAPGYDPYRYRSSPTGNVSESMPLLYGCSPTLDETSLPTGQKKSKGNDRDASAFLKPDARGVEMTQAVISSGRSTPQSKTGVASQSEGTSSSKSSASTFPRFIHSVFPLRRSSSGDRRGRSKTRRKREKKITKEKNKKKAKANNVERMSTKKPSAVEITSSPVRGAYKGFPVRPPRQHYSALTQHMQHTLNTSDYRSTVKAECANNTENARRKFDQESLDKIILSESDDAHSKAGTPETARKADWFSARESRKPTKNFD